MAQQTINVGTAPNDGTGTPLRTAFQYTNSNFSELYTAVGPSGNNIVVPGNATITGDLGVGTASPSTKLEVATATANTRLRINSTSVVATEYFRSGTGLWLVGSDSTNAFKIARGSNFGGSADYFSIGSATADCTWFDAAGGTRMTLNSTGLGVGTTAAQKLTVLTNAGISAITATAADDRLIFTENMASANLGSQIVWKNSGNGNAYASIGFTNGAAGNNGSLIFSTSSSIFGSNNVERLRIDSSGNVGIGVTPSAKLDVQTSAGRFKVENFGVSSVKLTSSGSFGFTASEHQFLLGATQAMTLDASGNLLIGNTISPGNLNCVAVRKGSAGQLILVADNGGLFQQVQSNYYLVTTAGGSTSDKTLKKNIKQLSGALSKVCAINGVNFEFIEPQKCTADNGVQIGVIAQEVEAQYPEIVLTENDGVKRVRYDRLVAPLIEAIKELTARVQTLETR